MKLFSRKTVLEVLTSLVINLTSAWFGLLVVAPGFIGIHNFNQYLQSLTVNGTFGIVGLTISLWLTEIIKRYDQ